MGVEAREDPGKGLHVRDPRLARDPRPRITRGSDTGTCDEALDDAFCSPPALGADADPALPAEEEGAGEAA